MANVNVYADRLMGKRRGQKLHAPDLSMQGHQKREEFAGNKHFLPQNIFCIFQRQISAIK